MLFPQEEPYFCDFLLLLKNIAQQRGKGLQKSRWTLNIDPLIWSYFIYVFNKIVIRYL